jgi:hypothetical protein
LNWIELGWVGYNFFIISVVNILSGLTCAIKREGSTPTDVVLTSATVVLTSEVDNSGIGVVGDVGSRDGTVGTVSSR